MLPSHGRYDFSPITRRPKWRWPDGSGLAIYIALNVEQYAFGEGLTEDLVPAMSQPDVLNASWREYGTRVGAWR
ncbi:MAG: polysaccharide deacetylase, partial [Albidovulum sp.]|nr:polysaccharide deacetylase [Albidovulum sp.]